MVTPSYTEMQKQFRNWVLDYSDLLYNHAMMKGFEKSVAQDLVQETFYSAWKSIEAFEGKASAKTWLFVILKNKITDHFRKAAPIQVPIANEHQFFDDDGHWEKSAFPRELMIDPTSESDNDEFHRILENCSAKLNGTHKAVFWMKYMDDMDSDAICATLSISANNYWTMIHRAKVQLRACLEKSWLMIHKL